MPTISSSVTTTNTVSNSAPSFMTVDDACSSSTIIESNHQKLVKLAPVEARIIELLNKLSKKEKIIRSNCVIEKITKEDLSFLTALKSVQIPEYAIINTNLFVDSEEGRGITLNTMFSIDLGKPLAKLCCFLVALLPLVREELPLEQESWKFFLETHILPIMENNGK